MKKTSKITLLMLVMIFGFSLSDVYSGMMENKGAGMLTGAEDHHASGKVTIRKDSQGNMVLSMTGVKIDRVPDGRVYLAKGADYTKGVELGKLTTFSGLVEFTIPDNIDPRNYDSVVIWCEKFSVEIGHAYFGNEDSGKGE